VQNANARRTWLPLHAVAERARPNNFPRLITRGDLA
jgi:hypothetical protein